MSSRYDLLKMSVASMATYDQEMEEASEIQNAEDG